MPYGYLTPTGGFTVEFWFNRSAVPTWQQAALSQQSQNRAVNTSTDPGINGRQFIVYFNAITGPGAICVEVRNNQGTLLGSWADATSTPDYANDNEWHFFAMRLGTDKRTFHVWIDGVLKYQTTFISVLDWVPGVLSVGGAYAPHLGNFGMYLYSGGLAYVAAWDKALTDSRITEHRTAGIGGSVFYGDDEVSRLRRLYTFTNVPVNAQRFDAATTTLQGLQIAGENGLEKIHETAANAGGIVFADGQSVMVYQNRRHRYNKPVVMTMSEDTGSAPEVGMEFSTDDTKVFNDVRASRPDGGTARLRNRVSEDEYGQRVYELTLRITSDSELRNAGTWLVERYGEDRVRVSGVSLSAHTSDKLQTLAETLQIGDRIAFDDLPTNAPATYAEYVVEGISVDADFKAETWVVSLDLSPADLWDVFQVGVSTLGVNSRVAY